MTDDKREDYRVSFTVKDVTFSEFRSLITKWTDCPCCATETALFQVKFGPVAAKDIHDG